MKCHTCHRPLHPGATCSDQFGNTVCASCERAEEERTWLTVSNARRPATSQTEAE
jgi:predicted Fe-S protein YdhL (DUF1289 family)